VNISDRESAQAFLISNGWTRTESVFDEDDWILYRKFDLIQLYVRLIEIKDNFGKKFYSYTVGYRSPASEDDPVIVEIYALELSDLKRLEQQCERVLCCVRQYHQPVELPLCVNHPKLLPVIVAMLGETGGADFNLKAVMPDVSDRRSLMALAYHWNLESHEFDPTDDYEVVSGDLLSSYLSVLLEAN
jgi:hypothetical protein